MPFHAVGQPLLNELTPRQVGYSWLEPPCLSVDATAVAGIRIQDQSVHDASVRSARRLGRSDENPLLSCLAGLVLIKVDDRISHQGLYKGIIPGRRRQIRAWWPIWRSDLFHRIARARRHVRRIETLAAWTPHRLHTRAAVLCCAAVTPLCRAQCLRADSLKGGAIEPP
jgi:hypothetical protein